MRVADIAMFMFIFQLVLGMVLSVSSFSNVGKVEIKDNGAGPEELREQLNRAINKTECASWDIACQVRVAWQQFDATVLTPVRTAFMGFAKAIFLGRFLADVLKPIDYDGSLSRFLVIFDAIGGTVFVYGLIQLISGRAFKTMR